jgi:hypothetical protein
MRAIMSLLNTDFPCVVCISEEYDEIDWCDVEESVRPSKESVLKEMQRLRSIDKNQEYKTKRIQEYPSIEDQLDILYHEGYNGWKQTIQEVKDRYPKP